MRVEVKTSKAFSAVIKQSEIVALLSRLGLPFPPTTVVATMEVVDSVLIVKWEETSTDTIGGEAGV